jgi:predicted DNA-binding protein
MTDKTPTPELDAAGALERLIHRIEDELNERLDQLSAKLTTTRDFTHDRLSYIEREVARAKDEARSDLRDAVNDLDRKIENARRGY